MKDCKTYLMAVISNKEKGFPAGVLRSLLWVLSLLFGLVTALRAWVYQTGIIRGYRTKGKVISVGNITVGGSGKTPLAIYLAKYLKGQGKSPAVVTRGYMQGKNVQSDEVMMLRELLPGTTVLQGPDRKASIRSSNADVFILDDGFQHFAVARDLNILIIDSVDPFDNGHVLPRGLLREYLTGIRRANIIVLARSAEGHKNITAIKDRLSAIGYQGKIVLADHEPVSVRDIFSTDDRRSLDHVRCDVCAVSAIGSPRNFYQMLRSLGTRILLEKTHLDHHSYTREDCREIVSSCRARNINTIITTHKDAVKLKDFQDVFHGLSVLVVDIEMRIKNGENELLSSIDRLFGP